MRLLVFLLFINVFVFSACSNVQKHTENSDIINKDNQYSVETVDFNDVDIYEVYFTIGSKLRLLSDIPGIDDPVMLINGNAITKRDVESEKIYIEYLHSITLKERIELLIKNMVLTIEASKLGIEPVQEDIINHMENIKKANDYDVGQISGYIDGMGITKEEYLDVNEELAYNMYQRQALWQTVKKSMENEITRESKKRGLPISDVEKEYYEKYVDSLLESADVEILDAEIKKLFCDEFPKQ